MENFVDDLKLGPFVIAGGIDKDNEVYYDLGTGYFLKGDAQKIVDHLCGLFDINPADKTTK